MVEIFIQPVDQQGGLVATRSKRSASERARHNRWATLQWTLLALLAVLLTIALFVFVDSAGITGPN